MCEVIVCYVWVCEVIVCVKFVCVKLLYVTFGYVKLLYVTFGYVEAAGGREEEEKEKEPGIQNQKQEPHTKMWGKIGRPVGTFETKQQQYLKMLSEGKIKMPKASTLEFYKIERDGEVFKVMGE